MFRKWRLSFFHFKKICSRTTFLNIHEDECLFSTTVIVIASGLTITRRGVLAHTWLLAYNKARLLAARRSTENTRRTRWVQVATRLLLRCGSARTTVVLRGWLRVILIATKKLGSSGSTIRTRVVLIITAKRSRHRVTTKSGANRTRVWIMTRWLNNTSNRFKVPELVGIVLGLGLVNNKLRAFFRFTTLHNKRSIACMKVSHEFTLISTTRLGSAKR